LFNVTLGVQERSLLIDLMIGKLTTQLILRNTTVRYITTSVTIYTVSF